MNLKKIRMEKGLTVQQLADLAGLPKRTVEETVRRDTCSVRTAIKLADALGVTLDELCRLKSNNPMPSSSFSAAGRFSYSTTIVLISSRL